MANSIKDLVAQWTLDPVLFVEEDLKVHRRYGGRGISTQQKKALVELGKLVRYKVAYSKKVDAFQKSREWPNHEIYEDELRKYKETLDPTMVKYAKKRGISIMSGQGTGKDGFASWAILWFLTCFPNPKVPCTAPTAHQLYDVLWAEVSKWMRNSHKGENDEYVESVCDTVLEWQKTTKYVKEGSPEDSNIYRIRVLGLPPRSEEGKLIPWDWIEAAATDERREMVREGLDGFDPLKMGFDIGGGGDTSERCLREGGLVHPFKTYNNEDTMKTARWVESQIVEDEPDEVCMDNVGLGRGVFDRVREKGYRSIIGINVRNTPMKEAEFFQLRDELCWRMRDAFQNGTISIPDDDELKEQLGQPKYDDMKKGKIQVESKRQMKSRGITSPNKFDSLMLTFFSNDRAFRYTKMESTDEYEKEFKREQEEIDLSWMGV